MTDSTMPNIAKGFLAKGIPERKVLQIGELYAIFFTWATPSWRAIRCGRGLSSPPHRNECRSRISQVLCGLTASPASSSGAPFDSTVLVVRAVRFDNDLRSWPRGWLHTKVGSSDPNTHTLRSRSRHCVEGECALGILARRGSVASA